MTQSISGYGLSGTGIVSVLIIVGFLLTASNLNTIAGQVAIWGGVGIGLMLGLLGVLGVLSKYI